MATKRNRGRSVGPLDGAPMPFRSFPLRAHIQLDPGRRVVACAGPVADPAIDATNRLASTTEQNPSLRAQKDIVLLGAAVFTAGEAFAAVRGPETRVEHTMSPTSAEH